MHAHKHSVTDELGVQVGHQSRCCASAWCLQGRDALTALVLFARAIPCASCLPLHMHFASSIPEGLHIRPATVGACLQVRDLRILDPAMSTSYPSAILCRDKALLVNLEHIKCIITSQCVLVLNADQVGLPAGCIRDKTPARIGSHCAVRK